ncbi:MAG TPA: PepSY domain-containing protein [Candidatus Sulfotelmatobacter sp.]|nr:PepSY domain-containing protein [Candidatus Sulfotelmatobacter sp.]
MKIKNIIGIGLAAALLGGCAWGHCEKCEKHSEAELMAQAKVTKDAAQATALAKVPNGTIKEGELEKENGKLQWSFDVATPDSKDITEVNVDAITGEIISAAKESASDEAKEAGEDAKKKKDDKEDKD